MWKKLGLVEELIGRPMIGNITTSTISKRSDQTLYEWDDERVNRERVSSASRETYQ